MQKIHVLIIVGFVIFILGFVFLLQNQGALPSTYMSRENSGDTWTIIGGIMMFVGVVFWIVAAQKRRQQEP